MIQVPERDFTENTSGPETAIARWTTTLED